MVLWGNVGQLFVIRHGDLDSAGWHLGFLKAGLLPLCFRMALLPIPVVDLCCYLHSDQLKDLLVEMAFAEGLLERKK